MNVHELRERGCVPRVHGNGFIQVDLNKEGTQRLHVWDDDVPRQKVATPIHDHVFTLVSYVLCGTLIHEEFDTFPDYHKPSHEVWEARREEGTQNTTLQPTQQCVRIESVQRLLLLPESVYRFPALTYHQSDHIGTTATIMEKVNPPGSYGTPRVLVPMGKDPDNDFHRDNFDVRWLWQIIERAIG